MKDILYKTGLITLWVFLLGGCKELDLAPENEFTDLTYWTTEAKAQGVLNTAYSQMFNAGFFFYNEALSDNAYNGRGDTHGAASLASGTYDPSLDRLKEEWKNHYQGIKSCNILLGNIDKVDNMKPEVRARMSAEARFIRAFLHFQLMTWFGDVPLLKEDIAIEEAQTISRTPKSEVLAYVLDELDEVASILPSNTEYATADRGKITRGAAIALKARALLYEGAWDAVVTECEKLISDNAYGSYALFPSYEGLFLPENEFSSEDILSLQFVPQFRTWSEFFDMAPLSAGSRLNAIAPTQELVDSYLMLNGKAIKEAGSGYDEDNPYDNRDPRLTYTIVYHGYEWKDIGGTHTVYIKPGTDPNADNPLDEYRPGSSTSPTGYYWRKYFDPTHLTQFASGLNLMLIRYADVLLMYAEAKNEIAKLDQATWDMTIKALRDRAGFTGAALDYNASWDQDQLREVIRNERRTELALEGLRIFDIRRWRIAEDVLNGWAHGAKFGPSSIDNGYLRVNERTFNPNRHYLWPIPREERNMNPNLSQNTGWE